MTRSLTPFILALLIAGCSSPSGTDPWTVTEEPTDPETSPTVATEADTPPTVSTPTPKEHPEEPFVVHEWGTFTSLQGSNGEVQAGMHYEEESLPAFVYGRVPPPPPGLPPNKRVEEMLLDGITQKMETPVIYFYGAPDQVDVTVDFPHGVISQWYPDAASFSPEVYDAEFDPNDIVNGSMTWSLDVLEYGEDDEIIDVPEEDIWAPSRNVDSQPVRFGDEVEKFIFYRGLARFETPFRVTSDGDSITLSNGSEEPVADAWVLHWNGEAGAVWPIGSLPAGGSKTLMPTPKELPQPEYLEAARQEVQAGLVRSGLTEDEAWAMVDTWNHSYFKTPGLRVLYVVPRKWTDELLPIDVSPRPDELVRTLVGRVEVMTESDEREFLQRIEAGAPLDLERFGEARLQRALQLTDDETLRRDILMKIVQLRSGGY